MIPRPSIRVQDPGLHLLKEFVAIRFLGSYAEVKLE
jgi:hypothetical protein